MGKSFDWWVKAAMAIAISILVGGGGTAVVIGIVMLPFGVEIDV